MAKKDICDTPECGDPAVCAGFCGACYQWHWAHGKDSVKQGQQYRKRQVRIQARMDTKYRPRIAQRAATRPPARRQGRGESRAYLN